MSGIEGVHTAEVQLNYKGSCLIVEGYYTAAEDATAVKPAYAAEFEITKVQTPDGEDITEKLARIELTEIERAILQGAAHAF